MNIQKTDPNNSNLFTFRCIQFVARYAELIKNCCHLLAVDTAIVGNVLLAAFMNIHATN